MKKFLKIIGIILGVIILLIGGFLGYLKIAGMPKFSDVHRSDIKVESTPERVMRGRKIATLLCYDCHFNPSTNRLSVHFLFEIPTAFRDIYSHNITNYKIN